MTDNEIIKALDEWRKAIKDDYKRLQLLDAPMDCFEESHTVNFLLLSNAIDLINRQQAEIKALTIRTAKQEATIERLEDEKSALQSEVSDAQAEIERLQELLEG